MKTKLVMNQWTCRFALAGVTLMGASAFGADATGLDNTVVPGPAESSMDASGRLPITVTIGASQQFKSEIDETGADGSFTLTRANISMAMPVKLNDEFRLGTTVRYGLDSYSWEDVGGTDPWQYINTIQGSSILSWTPQDSNLSYFGGGFVKMAAESGISLNRAASGGGIVGLNYKVNDTLSIGGGLALTTVLEDDATILPLLMAKWQFAENWCFNMGLKDVATSGYGADVKWLFSKEWEFSIGAQVHKSRFRINGDQSQALTGGGNTVNGIVTEQATTLYVDSTWHASDKVDFGAFAGIAAGGKLKMADSAGDHEDKTDYKAAAIIGLKAALRF